MAELNSLSPACGKPRSFCQLLATLRTRSWQNRKPLLFAQRGSESGRRNLGDQGISFASGFPQMGEFLEEFSALSAPFLETKLTKLVWLLNASRLGEAVIFLPNRRSGGFQPPRIAAFAARIGG